MHSKSSFSKIVSLWFFVGLWAWSLAGQSYTWKPAMAGIQEFKYATGRPPRLYKEGPNGRPWVVGSFIDEDSINRVAAYWENQRWKPLPLRFDNSSFAFSMVQYGDTTYIGGGFGIIGYDGDSQNVSLVTTIIKIFDDSIWIEDPWRLYSPEYWTVKNDTLLALNTAYFGPIDTVEYFALTDDGGATWRYPFNPPHPTGGAANFNILVQARIHKGDIYITNNADTLGSPYRGVARWDGQQWHSLGKGTPGFNSQVWAMEFFQGDLYVGGTFNKRYYPDDPGVHFARWDGQKWNPSGNPVDKVISGLTRDDTVLYAVSRGDTFGDVRIPAIAAWDGHKWCGTPTEFLRSPVSIVALKDTLLALFFENAIINGDTTLPNIVYFDGDYLNGPNAICSTEDLGVRKQELPTVFNLYPNPSDGQFYLEAKTPKDPSQVQVYSMQGVLLHQEFWSKQRESLSLDLGYLPSGFYVLKINGQHAQQIVID